MGQAGFNGLMWKTITVVPSHKTCLCLTVRDARPGKQNRWRIWFLIFLYNKLFLCSEHHSVSPLLVETFKQNIINTNSWCFWYNDYNYNLVAHSDRNLHIWKPTAVTVWLTHDSALSGGCHMTAKMAGASLYRVFKMAIVNKRTTLWKTIGFTDAHQEAIFQV